MNNNFDILIIALVVFIVMFSIFGFMYFAAEEEGNNNIPTEYFWKPTK